MPPKFHWKKLVPTPDPKFGKPCTRSSLGISYLAATDACPTPRLIVYGGETIARTPLESDQATWACDMKDTKESSSSWRLIRNGDTLPSLRVAHAQAYHAPSSCVYVFGGRAGITMEEKAMNDVWKLDCSGPAGSEVWSQVQTKGDVPEARSFHKMMCVGGSLYVFGGCGDTSGRLADMHRLDLATLTWYNLGKSQHLRGRGGANFLAFDAAQYLGVVAGFAGEETNDGHLFNVKEDKFCDESLNESLEGLRPRSVCINGSFPSVGLSVIFGGEVDPSAKGHEGAGSFDNSLVLLDEKTGKYIDTIPSDGGEWPENRGWSAGTDVDHGHGTGKLFFFGGLSGDDANPKRLDDLWELEISK